ncbi:UNVERIFIED_CONTAM: hypothetical protein K2H54_040775 [Gekko kuhli]
MGKELPNLGPDFAAEVSSSVFMLEEDKSSLFVCGRKAHEGSTAALDINMLLFKHQSLTRISVCPNLVLHYIDRHSRKLSVILCGLGCFSPQHYFISFVRELFP